MEAIKQVLNPSVQEFISNNVDKNTSELALKYKDVEGVPIQFILQQIQGRQKSRQKLPTFFATPGVFFPPSLNLEQSSSEITADYKAKLLTGNSIADLTGGYGIDTISFAKQFETVFYVERNTELAEIVTHNLSVLNVNNVEVINSSAENFLKSDRVPDIIYLDPARRDQSNNKVFKFEDCEPDVVRILPDLFSKSSKILIKTSPLLDIKATIKALYYIAGIYVIAVENECKEVLYLLDKEKSVEKITITCINHFKNTNQTFEFLLQEEEDLPIELSLPLKFLYEPNASILKAGAFNSIAHKFNLTKLHPNSHLYTSDLLLKEFPGRRFEILQVCKYDKTEISSFLKSDKANITVRNFPESVDQIRKKLHLKDGGDYYLFATTEMNKKHIIVITRKAA